MLRLGLTSLLYLSGRIVTSQTVTWTTQNTDMTWEGWGCSLAWFANLFGNDTVVSDLLFSLKNDIAIVKGQSGLDNIPGLGFNIARYNVGGSCGGQRDGGVDEYQGVTTELCSYDGETCDTHTLTDYKRIQGFWMNWATKNVEDTNSWRWNVDLNQRAILGHALSVQPNMIFELFSNSPMWWMCKNDNTAGPNKNSHDMENLQSWTETDFAYYMAQVARYYKEHFGINFKTVEPFNEPRGNNGDCWWYVGSVQEGCCFDTPQQERVLKMLREELDRAGLENTQISASDESLFSTAAQTWSQMSQDTKDIIDQYNVHGYEGLTIDGRVQVREQAKAAGKTLWMSEYGEGQANGMAMVEAINQDMTYLQMSSWQYWQPMDESYGWSLINFKNNAEDGWWGEVKENWSLTNKYYMMAQFSRHIRPGMRVYGQSEVPSEAEFVFASDLASGTLVCVHTAYRLSDSSPKWTIDFSEFVKEAAGSGVLALNYRSWITTRDGDKQYLDEGTSGFTLLAGYKLQEVESVAWSVRTLEIQVY